MPKVICKRVGCKKLIEKGTNSGYCDEHIKEHQERTIESNKIKEAYNRINNPRNPKYKHFYNGTKWKQLREFILSRDNYLCQDCYKNKVITGAEEVHHILEISIDWDRRYDEDNLISLCKKCHSRRHGRFQGGSKKEKKVYIVYGAPLSGKTTYVINNKEDGDLVIDMDKLYQAITLLPLYNKPETVKANVFAIIDTLIDTIRRNIGDYNSAWIIGGYPIKRDREELAKGLKAELIYIDSNKEESLKRLKECKDYRKIMNFKWEQYIEEWFDKFEE